MPKPLAFVLHLTAILGASLASHASAATSILRCGDHGVVHLGDSTSAVVAQCQTPTLASQRVEYRTVHRHVSKQCTKRHCRKHLVEHSVVVYIDDWTYDFGKNRFVYSLRFENGVLHRIRNQGYSQAD